MEASDAKYPVDSKNNDRSHVLLQPSAWRIKRFALLGPPLALAALELSHPAHVGHDVRGVFFPVAAWWCILHIIQFALFVFLGISLVLLTEGCRGLAAVTSLIGTVVFVICYDLGDAVVGVSAGVLGWNASRLSQAIQVGRIESIQAIFNDPVINGIYIVGRAAWFVTLLSAAVAILFHRRAPVPAACLALSGVLLTVFDHPGVFGSLAFALLFIGALMLGPARSAFHNVPRTK